MKRSRGIAIILCLAGFASATGEACSHEMTPEMRMQHDSMSTIQRQWTAYKKFLEAGDFAAAVSSLDRMQKASDGLEKFKPHKKF